MAQPQIIIDSIEPKGDGYAVKLAVVTSDGTEHRNANGAHFTAANATELLAAIKQYADDHEAMVPKAPPAPLPLDVQTALGGKVGKVLNSATLAEETRIAAKIVAVEPE